MSALSKFELKQNEPNEINFKVNIEGTSSEPSSLQFRFILTESGSERGWIFPATREENSLVSVEIPALNESVQLDKKYHGKLEVLVGNVLLVPAEIIVEFIRPLQIEATSVSVKSSSSPQRASKKALHTPNQQARRALEEKQQKNKNQLEDEENINLEDYLIEADMAAQSSKSKPLDDDTRNTFQNLAFSSRPPEVNYESSPAETRDEAIHSPPTPPSPKLVESPISREAIAVKNNLKKAFLEALNSDDQEVKVAAKATPLKNSLEEARRLLMSEADKRTKKPHTKENEKPTAFKRPRSLKDLLDL